MKHIKKQQGFAIVEALLVILIVGVMVAVGYWVWKQRGEKSANTSTNSAAATVSPAKEGTTEGIDQLTQLDEKSESDIDQKYGTTAQTNAASSADAASNVGGAYNENSL